MVLEESFSLRLWFSDTTRLRRDYDGITTGLRRDLVSDDAIASCLFPGSIPCWVSCCQGASWGIVDFFGDYVEPIPHEREVCDWNLGACKCVKMREKSANLL